MHTSELGKTENFSILIKFKPILLFRNSSSPTTESSPKTWGQFCKEASPRPIRRTSMLRLGLSPIFFGRFFAAPKREALKIKKFWKLVHVESHSFNYFGHLSCCCWISGWGGFLALKPAVVKFHRKSSPWFLSATVLIRCERWALGPTAWAKVVRHCGLAKLDWDK